MGDVDCFAPGSGTQFGEDVGHVNSCGLLADEQVVGDLTVRAAPPEEGQYLHLTRRQAEAVLVSARGCLTTVADRDTCPPSGRLDGRLPGLGAERSGGFPRRSENLRALFAPVGASEQCLRLPPLRVDAGQRESERVPPCGGVGPGGGIGRARLAQLLGGARGSRGAELGGRFQAASDGSLVERAQLAGRFDADPPAGATA
jgi:hypothetical protein